MLEFIREKAKGIIAWAIIILIAVPFALWGINNYFTGDKGIVVAEVNGEKIPAEAFLRAYQRERQQLQQQLGAAFDQKVDDEKLRRQILDNLIESKLIQQWARDHHMAISDAQLAAVIQSAPIFLNDKGQFDQKKYEQLLANNGLTVAQFEQLQRQFLLEQQYRNLTLASSLVTPTEVNQLVLLQQQQRKAGWIRFDLKPYLARVKVSDQQIAAYYDAHKGDFVEPERVVVDYVLLDKQRLANTINPDAATLKQFYADNKDLYAEPEERRVRHILIRAKRGDKASEQAALAKIKTIQEALKAGKSFAELAKKYSQDPGSASVGGDLGYFEQGLMAPEFDKKVFSMKKGEVSGPVQTDFGYHLILLEDIKPRRVLPYDQVKDRVLQAYRQQQADKRYYDLLEKLNTIAYEQPDSLEPAAEAIGAKVETSKPFAKGKGTALFANPKVNEAVFSDDVYNQHLNSPVVELDGNRAVVVRLNKVIPSRQLSLAEVKTRIRKRLTHEEAVAQARADAEKILKALRAGTAPEKVIKPGMTWQAPKWISRERPVAPPAIQAAIFKAPKPHEGKPGLQLISLPDGAPAIIVVEAVRAEANKVPEVIRKQLKLALRGLFGEGEVVYRIAQLKKAADIEINKAYLTLK